MIELGLILLQHRSSIFEARNKIRGLADALGYDPIDATRLATAVSEATRELLRNSREPRIAVALAMEISPPQLVLDFEGRGAIPHLAGLAGFFDGLRSMRTQPGVVGQPDFGPLEQSETQNVLTTGHGRLGEFQQRPFGINAR